jgi:hypothetical protein
MAATARQGETTRSSPAPITTHPYIGIAGVFLGAATSTLNGRLVSVGLPDLRGALGFSFDGASWIPTVLNMGMIFIGVFAVFLGAAYGYPASTDAHRRGVHRGINSAAFLAKPRDDVGVVGRRGNVVRGVLHADAHVRRSQPAA